MKINSVVNWLPVSYHRRLEHSWWVRFSASCHEGHQNVYDAGHIGCFQVAWVMGDVTRAPDSKQYHPMALKSRSSGVGLPGPGGLGKGVGIFVLVSTSIE